MNAKTDVPSPNKFDAARWVIVAVLVAAGVVANSVFASESLLLRILGWTALFVIAGGVALTTAPGRRFWSFSKEARNEVRKVIWPTRQETTQTTLIVLVMVLIVGLFLWLLDWLLGSLASWLIG